MSIERLVLRLTFILTLGVIQARLALTPRESAPAINLIVSTPLLYTIHPSNTSSIVAARQSNVCGVDTTIPWKGMIIPVYCIPF
jgi:hypothetical protein